eukprot:758120-Hanusia_phi.AAC.4
MQRRRLNDSLMELRADINFMLQPEKVIRCLVVQDAMPSNPASALRELIGQKERELQEMNELRIQEDHHTWLGGD